MITKLSLLINEVEDKFTRENFKKIISYVNTMRVREFPTYNNTNRPTQKMKNGDTIFNSDDGKLNIWVDGKWTLPDGSTT